MILNNGRTPSAARYWHEIPVSLGSQTSLRTRPCSLPSSPWFITADKHTRIDTVSHVEWNNQATRSRRHHSNSNKSKDGSGLHLDLALLRVSSFLPVLFFRCSFGRNPYAQPDPSLAGSPGRARGLILKHNLIFAFDVVYISTRSGALGLCGMPID